VHGLAEGYLAASPTADVNAVFPHLCKDPKARSGCAHGIGHALYRDQSGTSIRTSSDAALTQCDGLPANFVIDCDNGVYMELAIRTHPAPIPVADFVDVCSSTAGVERSLSCWSYLGASFTSNDTTSEAIPAWCGKAPLPSHYTCIEGYGRTIGISQVAKCGRSAPTVGLRERCVDGAVGLQVGSGHVSRRDANDACRTMSNTKLESYCLSAVKRYMRGRAKVEAQS
jgi:hypothetical protein